MKTLKHQFKPATCQSSRIAHFQTPGGIQVFKCQLCMKYKRNEKIRNHV